MNSSLSPVSDLVLRENIGKLVEVKNKLDNVKNKITMQNEEMIKTVDIIEKFKNCYNEQNEALKKFTEDQDKLLAEYDALILIVQGKSDKEFSGCDNAPNVISGQRECVAGTGQLDAAHAANTAAPHSTDIDLPRHESPQIPARLASGNKAVIAGRLLAKKQTNGALPPMQSPLVSNSSAGAPANASKKLKRKGSANPPPANDGKQRKADNNKRKKSRPGEAVPGAKQKQKDKTHDQAGHDINVLVKVDSFRLEKVVTVADHAVIHKMHATFSDVFVCGSIGLLAQHGKYNLVSYGGHQKHNVRDFYIHCNHSILSLGPDYVLLHRMQNSANYQTLATFASDICASCVYKTKLYGILSNGSLFIVEMITEKVTVFLGVVDAAVDCRVISVVVVKVNNNKLLIVANSRNEIVSYSLNEPDWLQRQGTLSVSGTLQGMKIYSSSIICYTSHAVLLLDKHLWKMSLVREIANNIVFLEADMNHIIVLDNCNILHKYIIKKGRIRTGSTVEYLHVKEKVTAMYFSFASKKIYFATGNELYNQKF